MVKPAGVHAQGALSQVTEPHILYPAIAVLVLAAIWGITLNMIWGDRASAERTAVVLGRELTETYEAQVVRALREIDQTLKFVKYVSEFRPREQVLQELKARGLLLPDMVFVISITDRDGTIVAGTRARGSSSVAGEDYFQTQRVSDTLAVSHPQPSARYGEWELHFSRRLVGPDGKFSGIAMVTVDAAYFVSGYESSKLGEQGMLGLLGIDGVFRAGRIGDNMLVNNLGNFSAFVPATDDTKSDATLFVNPWDGVLRYTSARKLYDFPLVVVVGLAAEEQLAAAGRDMGAHLWRAAGVSLVLLVVVAVLGRQSAQLAASRRHAAEDQVEHAKRVEFIAYHDSLTQLPNRRLFNEILERSISQARRYDRHLAVLFLDLDLFKNINDTLGHGAGDQLLRDVAARLKGCLRDSDTVARLGGDEFVALLPELAEERYVLTVAQKILATIARPFILLGQEFRITASVGISVYPQDGRDIETLEKNADIAMYQAKKEGKNNFQFYSRELNANSLERQALESGLRGALVRNEFQLHYQVKREIRTSRISGMEALLRWHHPDLGIVAPMQFIPVAEETGLIVPIGKWVLLAACQQNVAWQNQGLPRLVVSVNLSPRQFFDTHLLDDLAVILASSGMDAHLLELEITESLLMREVEKTLRILRGLKAMGLRIAIDDFGVGYSSLAMLKQFPLDTIKIDRSFIRDLASVAEDKALTDTIIALGRTLSLTVVAQGVETKEQADFLREKYCDEFQGFYLNKPLPAEQVAELLRPQAEADANRAGDVGSS